MSFYQGRKGAELLRQWLVEQSLAVDLPAGGGPPKIYCPQCKRELGVYFGRRSELYRIHHYQSNPHERCPLEFETWTGKDRSEAVSSFMQFSYAYRPEEPAVDVPESDEPGAAPAAGESGNPAGGGGAEADDGWGERLASYVDGLSEDAGNCAAGGPVWEEE